MNHQLHILSNTMDGYLLQDNLHEDHFDAIAVNSAGFGEVTGGIGEPGKSQILEFDRNALRKHIRNWMDGPEKKNSFSGVAELEQAVDDCFLRPGQIIFGTVSIKHHQGEEGTPMGFIYDIFTPIITLLMMKQKRYFAYLHAAIYVGRYKGVEYVVENAGMDQRLEPGNGRIRVSPIEQAFEKTAHFFVVSPEKDKSNRSRRYIVAQRALACVGLQYMYGMRSVSCEAFVLAILCPLDNSFDPVQSGLVRSHKKDLPKDKAKNQLEMDRDSYEKFHEDMKKRIGCVQRGIILTLDFLMQSNFLKNEAKTRNAGKPQKHLWFKEMEISYYSFWEACER